MTGEYPTIKDQCGDLLQIHTLGRFQVSFGDRNLFNDSGRYQKIRDLFMFFITHRGKPVHPDNILETLWPDKDYSNPRNALKNMVYRLKQGLEDMQVPEAKSFISYSYGGYSWNSNSRYWLDADHFEALCSDAHDYLNIDSFSAADKFRQALTLYLGHYLPECQQCSWVLPKRHYYRRLFVRSVSELFAFQKENRLFAQMAEDCEKALSIEDFDENIHLFYMEALLEEGKTAQARSHYEYITSLNYHALGAKPSPAMQHIYRIIKTHSEKARLDYTDLRDMLTEKEKGQGALFCEPDNFNLFCRLEKRRSERFGHPVQLGLLTLTDPDLQPLSASLLQGSSASLRKVILDSLRKVDIISPWNDNQFALLLPGLDYTQAESILLRVREAFEKNKTSEKVTLRSKIYPVMPSE